MADEALRAMQQQSTMARQQAASELAALRHEVRAPLRGVTDDGSRCGHGCWESQATSRVLKTRGETGVQCSGVTLTQQCHDSRSWMVEAALYWMMLTDLQGSSSEHRVPGR